MAGETQLSISKEPVMCLQLSVGERGGLPLTGADPFSLKTGCLWPASPSKGSPCR